MLTVCFEIHLFEVHEFPFGTISGLQILSCLRDILCCYCISRLVLPNILAPGAQSVWKIECNNNTNCDIKAFATRALKAPYENLITFSSDLGKYSANLKKIRIQIRNVLIIISVLKL